MEPSAAGVAAPDTFVMVGPPTAELERGWPCLKYKQKEYQRKYDAKRQATPHRKAWQKEYDAKRRQKEDNDKQRRMGSGKQPAHVGGG